MSFSSAFQSLRIPARSIASGQLLRRPAAPSGSRSSSSSARKAAAVPKPHAPHGQLDEDVAGPSRCFCTSHRQGKASDLPLEELHYDNSMDSYRQAPDDYWQPAYASRSTFRSEQHGQPSTPQTSHDSSDSASLGNLLANRQNSSRSANVDTTDHNFFTPSVRQRSHVQPHTATAEAMSTQQQQHNHAPASTTIQTYIETLDPARRQALDERVRLLIRSGELSMPALSAEYGDLVPAEREQVCCHIMSQCIKEKDDARMVWDLYRTWTPPTQQVIAAVPAGPARSTLRRIQGDTVFRCCTYLHAAGMTRQAAFVAGDARLKPSQSRFLLEKLVYDLKPPPSPLSAKAGKSKLKTDANGAGEEASPQHTDAAAFAAADIRLAMREICDTMMNLMADGVSFKQKTVNRTLKLLCLTRARSRVVRLVRAAQRRAQLDLLAADQAGTDEGRQLCAAGGFSRLRQTEDQKLPQVVSTKAMESTIRLLCAQDSTGARTAYDLLSALDPTQRTAGMYDALMTVYGSFPANIPAKEKDTVGYVTVDEQLWHDICTLPHLSGPTAHTISARIICHTRKRKLDLIQSDLAFLRTLRLGSIQDLTENAKLSIVRCCIESGSLLAGFRYASILLQHPTTNSAFQSNVVATLLHAAQHIHLSRKPTSPTSSLPSRAQLLKRFLRHFSHLHKRFLTLPTDVEMLELFIQLLDKHQQWIKSETLWNMLRVVGQHFGKQDARLVGVIRAFQRVFENRGEVTSAQELQTLIDKLQAQKLHVK